MRLENSNLKEIIQNLINSRIEGDYWDFKAQHNNKAELIHDIICLANNPRHIGDRYLIFGVDDKCSLIEIKTSLIQADIIDILRNANFSGNSFPDLYLKDIEIDKHKLQVLIIKDKPEDRPYYLEKNYSDNKRNREKVVTINAGAIYTRHRDTNTPKDQTASLLATEKMWRSRFGIDPTPLERMTVYLLDFDGWEERKNGETTTWYYRNVP